jgi:nucleoid-associated protein YgaU
MFFRGSRYEPVPEAQLATPDGRTIRYKRVRFIPETPGSLAQKVNQGDRLDLISFRIYKDPEQFWRICDANLALLPEELVEKPGRRLLIPVPSI